MLGSLSTEDQVPNIKIRGKRPSIKPKDDLSNINPDMNGIKFAKEYSMQMYNNDKPGPEPWRSACSEPSHLYLWRSFQPEQTLQHPTTHLPKIGIFLL